MANRLTSECVTFFLFIQYHGDSDQTIQVWFIQYNFSYLMKHKTDYTQRTL